MNLRRTAGLLTGLALFVASAASAAPAAESASAGSESCLSNEQQSAFDVGALKSELSVLAVACSDEDDYNHFVETHRRELVSQDGTVNAWFKRVYGNNAQKRYDSYITLLANEQSQVGQHQGSDFCPRLKVLFAEATAVPSTSLPQYAAAKDLMPDGFSPCPSVAGKSTPARSSSRTRRSEHHK